MKRPSGCPAVVACHLPSGSVPAAPIARGTGPSAARSPAPPETPQPRPAQSARSSADPRGRPSVGLHFPPRPGQDVLAVHLVVQRMEPPRWTRLRGPIQSPLQVSRFVSGGFSLLGTHERFPPPDSQTKCGAFPPRVRLPRLHQYCAPLRLPLRSRPFRRYAAYRARRSQATHGMAPHGSHCWGGDGSLLFPRWLCQRSTPSTPLGSSGLLLQALHPFPGLRLRTRDSAPSWSPQRRGVHDAAGFASCCGPAGLHLPWRKARPRASTSRSPSIAGGLLRRCLGTSFGRTSTG